VVALWQVNPTSPRSRLGQSPVVLVWRAQSASHAGSVAMIPWEAVELPWDPGPLFTTTPRRCGWNIPRPTPFLRERWSETTDFVGLWTWGWRGGGKPPGTRQSQIELWSKLKNWLVVSIIFLCFHNIWDNHPNWLIFFRGVGIPPTRDCIKTLDHVRSLSKKIMRKGRWFNPPYLRKHGNTFKAT